MGKFKFVETGIEGLYEIEPAVHGDGRGYFFETYNERDFEDAGITERFVQDNQSLSVKGVLRGLHYQKKHPQGKLVRALSGEVFDVAVDMRAGSPTYGKWRGVTLSGENKRQFYIPKGFAHGFLTLSEEVVFAYKCTEFYHPEDEGGILWSDASIGIEWPDIGREYLLSEKDKQWPELKESLKERG
ncbi:MAG: dTDP-4-dehydrorhamnose 3,5-epimerase [Treponema sp.]|jgi:dTDP-4-dehydrorhamnose 3,5-epimerase|nr:dTDP-4-dehydrorhamnose 3,5-epimerase [Treponema sp.]